MCIFLVEVLLAFKLTDSNLHIFVLSLLNFQPGLRLLHLLVLEAQLTHLSFQLSWLLVLHKPDVAY